MTQTAIHNGKGSTMKKLDFEDTAYLTVILLCVTTLIVLIYTLIDINFDSHDVGDMYVYPTTDFDNPYKTSYDVYEILTVIDVKDGYCQYETKQKNCVDYGRYADSRLLSYGPWESDSITCTTSKDTSSLKCNKLETPIRHKVPEEHLEKPKLKLRWGIIINGCNKITLK